MLYYFYQDKTRKKQGENLMFTFKRALPEDKNLSSKNIKKVLETLNAKNIPMHSLLIMKDDALVFEKYYAPYRADTLHRMFSISKSFTAVSGSDGDPLRFPFRQRNELYGYCPRQHRGCGKR